MPGERMHEEADYASLLSAARAGADWAWTAIYRDLAPVVLRYLRAHGVRDCEDATGEVFVSIVRGLRDFEGDGRDFRAWAMTIAHHRLVDEWRRDQRTPVDAVPDEELVQHAPAGDPEAEALDHLADERALAIMRELTPQQRDVLFLRVFAGLTVDEVARVVGNTAGAVKALQNRALAAIRRELSREAVSE